MIISSNIKIVDVVSPLYPEEVWWGAQPKCSLKQSSVSHLPVYMAQTLRNPHHYSLCPMIILKAVGFWLDTAKNGKDCLKWHRRKYLSHNFVKSERCFVTLSFEKNPVSLCGHQCPWLYILIVRGSPPCFMWHILGMEHLRV